MIKNKTDKQGKEYQEYSTYVLEAKLVVGDMVFSIGSEFVENGSKNMNNEEEKQDCERKAFARLAKKLKKEYPRLKILLSGDALYACKPVMDICKENGTNVWQYKFNGSLAQKWFLHSYGDGTYSIYTPLGNDGTYRYCLDIIDASGSDFANVQIWQPNGTDAQRFSIGKTNFGTYVFFTKCSNYEKAVVLQEANCTEGINVLQYSFLSSPRETWILEPVNSNVYLGLDYARTNYNQYVPTYPNLSSFEGHSADCANFVSQSLLASGVHYEGDWKVYRKNYNYKAPTTVAQLNDSWELCQPKASPWTSAKYFERYWSKRANNVEVFTIDYVLNHPDEIFQKKFYPCDVVQLAYNRLGIRAESWHTMFITNYLKYNNKDSYALTYHSGSQIDKELLRICEEYKAQGRNDYLVFFSI